MSVLVFTKIGSVDRKELRISSIEYVEGRQSVTAIELDGAMSLLTTDEMVELHAQLARSLGYVD